MIELVLFVGLKFCALLVLVFIWAWVPIVYVWFWYVADSEIHGRSRTIWKSYITVFGIFCCIVYWDKIWPDPPDPNKWAPIDSVFQYVGYSFDEYKERRLETKSLTRTELGTEIRRYRLDGWRPPKHFYVDLTDLKTGESLREVYVSKHCNTGPLRGGDEYNIVLNKYELSNRPGTVQYNFANLNNVFCN